MSHPRGLRPLKAQPLPGQTQEARDFDQAQRLRQAWGLVVGPALVKHTTLLRIKNGVVKGPVEAIVYCGRDHLSHRLVALGLSRREAVFVLYLFGMIGGCIGIIVARPEVTPRLYLPVVGVAVLVLFAVGAVLDRAKVYESAPEKCP